jgi:hypothetical protein
MLVPADAREGSGISQSRAAVSWLNTWSLRILVA